MTNSPNRPGALRPSKPGTKSYSRLYGPQKEIEREKWIRGPKEKTKARIAIRI